MNKDSNKKTNKNIFSIKKENAKRDQYGSIDNPSPQKNNVIANLFKIYEYLASS